MAENIKLEVAKHLAMSEQNLSDVLKRLGIDWRTTSLDEIRVAYIKLLRESAAGRGSQEQVNSAIARTRKDNMAAELMEMQIAEKAGKLIPVDKIEPFITSLIIAARQQFISFPKKWVQELKAINGVDIDELYFETDINDALNQLSDSDIFSDDEDDTPPDESVGSTREIADTTMGD